MIKSNNVVLAPFTPEDLTILFDWINDREQVLFNSPYKPVHWEQHQKWFESVQQRSDMVIFGIRLFNTDKLIGSCQLHSIHPIHRTAELQIRIGDISERGHGYGSDAVGLLLDFGFKNLNLNRIYLHVFATNTTAIKTYEKAGFTREGLFRQSVFVDNNYVDIIVMSILREEYVK